MRVLIVTQYFTPEVTAASLRLHPLAAGLAVRGHDVEVICEMPSHPGGVVHEGFRRRLTKQVEQDGFRTRHLWTHASPSKRPVHRLLSYATFASSATMAGAAARRPDVVFASSPPLSVGVVGALLARRFRAPWVFDVRDLWPAVAAALGEVPNRRLLAFARNLERRLYESAAAITAATEPFIEHIDGMTTRQKAHLLPNGTTADWLEVGETEVAREDLDLPSDRFLWTYAGNIGLSQDLEVAIEAARLLGDGFRLLILGDGTGRAHLEEAAKRLPDGEVMMRPPVPPALAARYMRASDALLVSLSDSPVLGKTIPVKLYDSCAVGRPVVVAAPGESRRLALEEGAGLAVQTGDARALADAVRRLRNDAELRNRLAQGGRRFAARNLRENGVGTLEGVLEAAISN